MPSKTWCCKIAGLLYAVYLQRVEIDQQAVDLFLRHSAVEGWHIAAARENDLTDAIERPKA